MILAKNLGKLGKNFKNNENSLIVWSMAPKSISSGKHVYRVQTTWNTLKTCVFPVQVYFQYFPYFFLVFKKKILMFN